MDKKERVESLGEKASEVIVSSLGNLATKCNTPFCCNGELVGSATIVYSNSSEQWKTATFPSDSESPLVGLIEACSVASFGLNGETVTDTTYRDALKLEPDRFVTDFSVSSTSILFEIKKLVPQVCNIRTQLNKLNIYGPGGHFRSHVDTPKSKEMFGSLVVCLPTLFTGGSLVTRHLENKVAFDWSSTLDQPARKIKWASFFSNIEHEILPVTSGYRVTLTYNLYGMQTDILAPLISNPEIVSFKQLLISAIANPHFMREGCILGFRCQHKYVFEDLNSIDHLPLTLKGADYCIYSEVQSLGIPVVVKPLVDGNDGYIADTFRKFTFDEDGTCTSDEEDGSPPRPSMVMYGMDSCDASKITWCQETSNWEQIGGGGIWGRRECLGNEASIEFFYQEAVILVGVPKWCKQRQAIVMSEGGSKEGQEKGKEEQGNEEEEASEDKDSVKEKKMKSVGMKARRVDKRKEIMKTVGGKKNKLSLIRRVKKQRKLSLYPSYYRQIFKKDWNKFEST